MKALCDTIHSKGLKAGIYSGPGPWTCAGYVASYEHEQIDAKKFAEWGFDLLKYDWCSYRSVMANPGQRRELIKPCQQINQILQGLDRDILASLCVYGELEGDGWWQWGGVAAENWARTTYDLGGGNPIYGSLSRAVYKVGLYNATLHEYARPGKWNFPDYLLIGYHRVGDFQSAEPKQTTLSPNEQYTHMSMWCLMAAPLIFSGDMTRLDEFTLGILCNAEVIDVDQDPLGRQARIIDKTDEILILAKPMEDGSLAVGLFNLSEVAREIAVDWEQLGLVGTRIVRDLWRQQDCGQYNAQFAASVDGHGVKLVRLRLVD